MSPEPESLVLQLLRDMRAEMATKSDLAAVQSEMVDLRSEVHSLRADVASDLIAMEAGQAAEHLRTRKDLSEQIVGLRRAVIEYHTSVIDHCIIISELEARVRRLEQHLDLPPAEAH